MSLLLAALLATQYGALVERYRSGAFVEALREAMTLPMDELEDGAEALRRTPGTDRLQLLGSAMLHLDLAAAARMEPEQNEEIAWRTLVVAGGEWATEARYGLVGTYWEMGRWEDVVRILEELRGRDRTAPPFRLLAARFSEMAGWTTHDERFFGYAWSLFLSLLEDEEPALPPGDMTGVRLRLAHLALRNGDPEEALERLDALGPLTPVQRFASLVIRGETLLWLGEFATAETALAEAQAIHVGSFTVATALATARRLRGDLAGAEAAVRTQLAAADGEDAWWRFLSGGLEDEQAQLARLRRLALNP